ncbi:CACNA1H [Symbiodinium necroappetens]|uniref:CACNA1H protein n=1 Tax=Symbiodinium necroappetens TaxID=1628268 RepID=A0A812KD83_9DINO|nr:CACNA1H [Symbiodinium necroappetens]
MDTKVPPDLSTLPADVEVPEDLRHSPPASPGICMAAPDASCAADLQCLLMQQHREIMQQLAAQHSTLQNVVFKARLQTTGSLMEPAASPSPVTERQSIRSSVASSASSIREVEASMSMKAEQSSSSPGLGPQRRYLKTFSALDRALRRAASEVHRSKKELLPSHAEGADSRHGCLVEICSHPFFEAGCTLAVLANAIFIGFETQHAIQYPGSLPPEFFFTQAAFAAIFTVELLMRIGAGGKRVFFSNEWMWGWLDLVVVVTSVWQLVNDALILYSEDAGRSGSATTLSSIRAFRIIRVARILRAVRIVKVLRFVTALRTLVTSIFHTLKSLFWAMVLLVLIVYVFAALFSQAIHDHMNSAGDSMDTEDIEAARRYYGSLAYTMLSLFMSISGGVSWFEVIRPLEEAHRAKIRRLFSQFGGEDCTTITFAMFEETIKSPEVREYFESLGLDIWDAWSFFKLLDLDAGGEVEIDEFLMGCLRLRGNARAVDVGKLIHDQTWLIKMFGRFQCHVEDQLSQLTAALSVPLRSDGIETVCDDLGSGFGPDLACTPLKHHQIASVHYP